MNFSASADPSSREPESRTRITLDTSLVFRDVELADNQRFSTWGNCERLQRGPLPRPDWVIEDLSAIDTDLGVLKTGKEGDVFLVERATENRSTLLACKRYRTADHRQFARAAEYREGLKMKRARDDRALAKGSEYGRMLRDHVWSAKEWQHLVDLYTWGAPVPYPVQIQGLEILMEFVENPDDPGTAAPRLQAVKPDRAMLDSYWQQLRDALFVFAEHQIAHGDLSPYNVLAAGDRLVVIDLPQVTDIVGVPRGLELLRHDCVTMCDWFSARGYEQDAEALFAELVAAAW